MYEYLSLVFLHSNIGVESVFLQVQAIAKTVSNQERKAHACDLQYECMCY